MKYLGLPGEGKSCNSLLFPLSLSFPLKFTGRHPSLQLVLLCPLPCCWMLLPVLVLSPPLLWWSLSLCPAKPGMAWTTAVEMPNTAAHAGVPRPRMASGAVLGGKQEVCLASVLFFLISPNELHFISAKNMLLPCLPEFWSLCMGVDDPR